MKYFIDTEFHEYHKQINILGKKVGKPIPTIDLISIGIVCEDGREYFAVSRDFNLEDIWKNIKDKNVWLLNNVLKPLDIYLTCVEHDLNFEVFYKSTFGNFENVDFNYRYFKRIINKYGKTNAQIAEEISIFCNVKELEIDKFQCHCGERTTCYYCENIMEHNSNLDNNVEFYGYYADYDWVVFAQLFGKMIDLPEGFPFYCVDLIQEMKRMSELPIFKCTIKDFKNRSDYPKQEIEHHALYDARWNFELYKFLNNI